MSEEDAPSADHRLWNCSIPELGLRTIIVGRWRFGRHGSDGVKEVRAVLNQDNSPYVVSVVSATTTLEAHFAKINKAVHGTSHKSLFQEKKKKKALTIVPVMFEWSSFALLCGGQNFPTLHKFKKRVLSLFPEVLLFRMHCRLGIRVSYSRKKKSRRAQTAPSIPWEQAM